MKFTEDNLKQYAQPLSETEDQKCKNAISMVADALKELGFSYNSSNITRIADDTAAYQLFMDNFYNNRKVKIFVQGSYANNTNVRTLSDVDIAVVQEEIFITKYKAGVTNVNYGFSSAASPQKSFKDEVQDSLKQKFGNDVIRKNKSIKINGNAYRKDADAVPCKRYRDYTNDSTYNQENYVGGIIISPDSGGSIINYPEQHIFNGVQKNNNTNYYFKKMVRIVKKIRYLMQENNIYSASQVSSFGLESLLWNIPNEIYFKYDVYRFLFDELVKYLFNNKSLLSNFFEVNNLKKLCPNYSDINFYTQFINDLSSFYEYNVQE